MQIQFTKSMTHKILAEISVALFIVFVVTQSTKDMTRPTVLIVLGALAFCGFTVASFLWDIKLPLIFHQASVVLLFLIAPFVSFITVETLQQSKVVFASAVYFLNLAIYFIVYLVLLIVTNRVHMSVIIGSLLFWIIGLVNCFMIALRDSPLLPWDLFAAHTVFNVLPGLKFTITEPMVSYTALTLLMCAISMQIPHLICERKRRLLFSGIELIMIIGLVMITREFMTPSASLYNTDVWSVVTASAQNGFVDNFLLNLETLNNPPPSGYSKEEATKIVQNTVDNYHAHCVSRHSGAFGINVNVGG